MRGIADQRICPTSRGGGAALCALHRGGSRRGGLVGLKPLKAYGERNPVESSQDLGGTPGHGRLQSRSLPVALCRAHHLCSAATLVANEALDLTSLGCFKPSVRPVQSCYERIQKPDKQTCAKNC
jgi:hypothetical protein